MLYAASHKENDDAFGTSDVFAQMEDDIRKESLKKISEETERAYQNGELKTEEAAPEVATSFAEAAVPEAPGAIAQDPDFIEANFDDEEPVSGANDLTANGEDEIAAMEDDSDHDEIYDDESVAFSDDVNGDYKESDAFAHEDHWAASSEIGQVFGQTFRVIGTLQKHQCARRNVTNQLIPHVPYFLVCVAPSRIIDTSYALCICFVSLKKVHVSLRLF